MAINTEWLWTPHDHHVDGGKYNRGDMSVQAYAEELGFYASLIKRSGTHVVALSEIENGIVADDLARQMGSDWRAYFKQGRDTATGQDVAILSNLTYIKGSLTDFNFPSGHLPGQSKQKRLSKVLGVRFRFNSEQSGVSSAQEVGVITAHFLSKRNENKRKSQNRKRQAWALLKAIKTFNKQSDSLIVLGDFNDYRGSPTIAILQKQGNLQSSETKKKSIDHILYKGLDLKNYQRYDLKSYSDHFAVYAEFR